MSSLNDLPWPQIHEFLVTSGNIRVPRDFCVHITENITRFFSYDQAKIYFLNDNGKIFDTVLYNADQSWINAYLEYYSKIENGRYSMPKSGPGYDNATYHTYDWHDQDKNEFITDYIKPQRLRYSLAINFHDETNLVKAVCTFDRTQTKGYTKKELLLVEVVQSHLDNLHKNLFVVPQIVYSGIQKSYVPKQPLTQRESEIVQLICDGVTPASIARKLCLSKSTVYRHIANVHEKLQVSNRQELILTILHQKAD